MIEVDTSQMVAPETSKVGCTIASLGMGEEGVT